MLKCEKCSHNLTLDDFWLKGTGMCSHKVMYSKIGGKYACPKCNYSPVSSGSYETGSRCMECVNDIIKYDAIKAKKPKPTVLTKGDRFEFHIESDDTDMTYDKDLKGYRVIVSKNCKGHWMETYCCEAICTDCKEQECCCMGIYHCCCEKKTFIDLDSDDNECWCNHEIKHSHCGYDDNSE